jgi:hypothetical protein
MGVLVEIDDFTVIENLTTTVPVNTVAAAGTASEFPSFPTTRGVKIPVES